MNSINAISDFYKSSGGHVSVSKGTLRIERNKFVNFELWNVIGSTFNSICAQFRTKKEAEEFVEKHKEIGDSA